MQDSNTKKSAEGNSKKKARKQIEKKLEVALSNLRPILGNKKFKRRIKKAGKVFSSGIKNLNANGAIKNKNVKTSISAIKAEP
jgi:hypothetical protein